MSHEAECWDYPPKERDRTFNNNDEWRHGKDLSFANKRRGFDEYSIGVERNAAATEIGDVRVRELMHGWQRADRLRLQIGCSARRALVP